MKIIKQQKFQNLDDKLKLQRYLFKNNEEMHIILEENKGR